MHAAAREQSRQYHRWRCLPIEWPARSPAYARAMWGSRSHRLEPGPRAPAPLWGKSSGGSCYLSTLATTRDLQLKSQMSDDASAFGRCRRSDPSNTYIRPALRWRYAVRADESSAFPPDSARAADRSCSFTEYILPLSIVRCYGHSMANREHPDAVEGVKKATAHIAGILRTAPVAIA